MSAICNRPHREYRSGETVEPGLYVDVETGAVVQIREIDELPDGNRVVQYDRRFRRLESAASKTRSDEE